MSISHGLRRTVGERGTQMSIGTNIKRLREEKGFTQEKLAEMLGVTFQAISSWERDEYRPELDTFIRLTEVLEVPSTSILEDKSVTFKTKDAIYNWEHMKTYVKTMAKAGNMENTLKAVDFAVKAHEGQQRKNTTEPYISHPLTMACHALAMGIKEDEIIAAILLHDVIEESRKDESKEEIRIEDLPVNEKTKELVDLMTCPETTDENRKEILDVYYGKLAKDSGGALVKCIDRCNNLTTMSWGLSRERIYRMIGETEHYYPTLLKTVKNTYEYNDAAWMLQYQMESMLDIYKRLM